MAEKVANRGLVSRRSLRHLIVRRGTLAVVLLVSLAILFFESQLLTTLEAVSHSVVGSNGETAGRASTDLFATCDPQELSRRITRFLSNAEGDRETLPWSWLLEINRAYGKQLLFTLALVLPVALFLAGTAFLLAFLTEQAERRGWQRFTNRLIEVVDGVPYILWTIPAILIALAIYRQRPWGWHPPYPLYLGLIFLGFGAFLLVFYWRENRQQIIAQRIVLDGERMTGIGEIQLFWRLFRFSFAPATFPRQWLYAAVFIMLLDFSFFTVLPTHQPNKPSTVFAESNLLHEQTIAARVNSGCDYSECYLDRLVQLMEADLKDAALETRAEAILRQPGRALNAERRQELCLKIEEAAWATASADDRAIFQQFAQTLRLPASEQEAIFFRRLSLFYIQLNGCLTFIVFFTVFMVFDARVLSDGS